MTKFLKLQVVFFFVALNIHAQSIDSLQLYANEIPEGYTLTNDNNCISIQACSFYYNPSTFSMLIGSVKTKKIQSFDSKKDKGSIMYFEFEDGFKGDGFLDGLLWGGDKPTKEHPEEYFAKGNFLVIWSFRKGSLIAKASILKVKAILQ